MKEGYSVTVSKWGEPILTIEPNCLSGDDLSDDDSRAIWDAGEHLKSFAGDPDGPAAIVDDDERHDRDQARIEALEAENARLRRAIWDACCVLEQVTFSDVRDNPMGTLEAIEKLDGDLSVALGPARPFMAHAAGNEARTEKE